MKRRHRPHTVAGPWRVRPLERALGVALLAGGFASGVLAQTSAPQVWVETRIGAGVTLSSNGSASASGGSEQAFEVTPGIQAVANTARLKGSLDYSLRASYNAQGTSGDGLRHALNAQGQMELWDNRAFLDVSGTVSDQQVSAFGALGSSGISNTNQSQTTSVRFSPYFKGRVANLAEYEARYTHAGSHTEQSTRSDSRSDDLSLSVRGQTSGPLGWTARLETGTVDYSLTSKTQSDLAQLDLFYALTPQLMLSAMGGVERNDVLTPEPERYNMWGVGVDWRPSERSRLALNLQDRYFGRSHSLQAEYRTGRTLWRVRDSRNVSSTANSAGSVAVGTLADLLDAYYLGIQPDPVLRAQLVQAELLSLGLSGDTLVLQSFLSSAASVARTQSLSAIVQGRRTVVTFTLSRSRTSRLQSIITLGDDFDSESAIEQDAFSISVGHRLTPLTALSADWSLQRNAGSTTGLSTRAQAVSLRLTTQLAPRTSASLQLRRSVQNGTTQYSETSVAGFVNHRF